LVTGLENDFCGGLGLAYDAPSSSLYVATSFKGTLAGPGNDTHKGYYSALTYQILLSLSPSGLPAWGWSHPHHPDHYFACGRDVTVAGGVVITTGYYTSGFSSGDISLGTSLPSSLPGAYEASVDASDGFVVGQSVDTGTVLWANMIRSSSGRVITNDIIANTGAVFVAGSFAGGKATVATLAHGDRFEASLGSPDTESEGFIVAYSSRDGDVLWQKSIGGAGNQALTGLGIDRDRLYFIGHFTERVQFGAGEAITRAITDGAVGMGEPFYGAVLVDTGAALWMNKARATGIVAVTSGTIYDRIVHRLAIRRRASRPYRAYKCAPPPTPAC
jgi:hypothetical protein